VIGKHLFTLRYQLCAPKAQPSEKKQTLLKVFELLQNVFDREVILSRYPGLNVHLKNYGLCEYIEKNQIGTSIQLVTSPFVALRHLLVWNPRPII